MDSEWNLESYNSIDGNGFLMTGQRLMLHELKSQRLHTEPPIHNKQWIEAEMSRVLRSFSEERSKKGIFQASHKTIQSRETAQLKRR